ncbi:MAG: hypothetical protein BM556_01265 [Bacteriovorax sp. MedPE-SWde]|nr:MAG: hypothetical protein BM556_01265 [Bacteriovorax sp. MedPE-SWde]
MKNAKDFIKNYTSVIFFSVGFLFDVFTLGEIDDSSNILFQFFYLIFATALISIEYRGTSNISTNNKFIQVAFNYRKDAFHFFLGSLLSSYTLFYFKSSSISNSFIFLFFIALLLILNELPRVQKKGIIVRTVLLYTCILSFLTYIIPTLFGFSGVALFISSLVIGITLSYAATKVLNKYNDSPYKNSKELLIPHSIITVIFLFLYIFRVFPPIPLSLKYIGIYHEVIKKDQNYITKELRPWWKIWHNGDQDFSYIPGDKIYVFTKIFAPTGFKDKVFIHWLKKVNGSYQSSDRIALNVKGARREGYRAFAYKKNISVGGWQVRIETATHLEIGRINFNITKSEIYEGQRKYKTLTN